MLRPFIWQFAVLHVSVSCPVCPVRCLIAPSGDTISLLLSHRSISPNAVYPPGSGTTALHLAASLSRTDVVNLLLDTEGIDDSLRDANGKTALEVARGKETIRAIRGKSRVGAPSVARPISQA